MLKLSTMQGGLGEVVLVGAWFKSDGLVLTAEPIAGHFVRSGYGSDAPRRSLVIHLPSAVKSGTGFLPFSCT